MAIGCTVDDVAFVLGWDRATIAEEFAEELVMGRVEGFISVRQEMFRKAMSGDTEMLLILCNETLGEPIERKIPPCMLCGHAVPHDRRVDGVPVCRDLACDCEWPAHLV